MAEDYPKTLLELERRFATDEQCRAYLWHSVGQRDLSVEAVARTKPGPRNEVGSSARPAGIQQP